MQLMTENYLHCRLNTYTFAITAFIEEMTALLEEKNTLGILQFRIHSTCNSFLLNFR